MQKGVPVSILYKSLAGHYRPNGPITAHYRFIKMLAWVLICWHMEVEINLLTLKCQKKIVSENVVCLCRLLNILANFSNLFLHAGKQCGPRSEC